MQDRDGGAPAQPIRAQAKITRQLVIRRAQGRRDAAKIETEAEVYAIEETAKAELKAGQLLEQTPVAVDIRMAETAANALAKSQSSLVIAPDAAFSTLMSLIGSSKRMNSPGKLRPLPKLSDEKSCDLRLNLNCMQIFAVVHCK